MKMGKENGEGDCFMANGEWIVNHYPHIKTSKETFLCHGMVTGAKGSKGEGLTFIHAWIEIKDDVLDCSNKKQITLPKELLYSKGRIIKDTVRRYSPDQALDLMCKNETYGPWR